MAKQEADPSIVAEIRRLAEEPSAAKLTRQARSDLMAWGQTMADICDAICAWIDDNHPVHAITTKYAGRHMGKPAYVMKPRMCDSAWYVKVSVNEAGSPGEYMLVISAHPDH